MRIRTGIAVSVLVVGAGILGYAIGAESVEPETIVETKTVEVEVEVANESCLNALDLSLDAIEAQEDLVAIKSEMALAGQEVFTQSPLNVDWDEANATMDEIYERQDKIIERADEAVGSFVWAALACNPNWGQ